MSRKINLGNHIDVKLPLRFRCFHCDKMISRKREYTIHNRHFHNSSELLFNDMANLLFQ